MLDLIQLLQVPHIDNTLRFDLSADGQSAVFSWNKTGKWEVYEMSFTKGDAVQVRQINPLATGDCFVPRSDIGAAQQSNPLTTGDCFVPRSDISAAQQINPLATGDCFVPGSDISAAQQSNPLTTEDCFVPGSDISAAQQSNPLATGDCFVPRSDIGAKFAPAYSPDGKKITYALDLDGSESYHIVLHDLESDIATDLTPDIAYAHQPYSAWSPDGNQLAVLSDASGHFALYLLTIATCKTNLLFDIHRPGWDVRWSPNGKWLAVEVEAEASERAIYIVNSDDGAWREIKNNGKALNAEHPAWSPDSQQLAFSGESGEWHDIGLYEVKTSEVSWLSRSAGDDSFPCWSRDGKHVGWIHAEGAATSIEVHAEPCQRENTKQFQVGAGLHSFPQFTSDGRSLVFVYESPSQPPDLWNLNLDDDSFTQLTFSMPDELRDTEFIQPEEVWYTGKDGVQVPAMLYRAKNADASSPAIVNIHGGPNWHFSFLWYPVMSYMASRGWTVLAPNYRGSTSYGKKWQNASRFDMGGVDTDDCAAGVKYLIENELADKNKIAVTGRSHGGYLTMTCMTMYPELWTAGSAVVPFLNWIKSHYESREDLQHWNIENMGDPEENRELWIARSPYFLLDKINAPVQMICGGNDPRCPASESMDARDKLVELGKHIELLLYKDEGHAFLNTDNVIDSEVKRVEFLAKVLENK